MEGKKELPVDKYIDMLFWCDVRIDYNIIYYIKWLTPQKRAMLKGRSRSVRFKLKSIHGEERAGDLHSSITPTWS